MNCYLDSSALVKRYLLEKGSSEVLRLTAEAERVGTAAISRAEVVAALAKAARIGTLANEDAELARRSFHAEWPYFARFRVTDLMIEVACVLGWRFGLRGYDSVQLAAASLWQEAIDSTVVMATFDAQLWDAAVRIGLEPFPNDMRLLKV